MSPVLFASMSPVLFVCMCILAFLLSFVVAALFHTQFNLLRISRIVIAVRKNLLVELRNCVEADDVGLIVKERIFEYLDTLE